MAVLVYANTSSAPRLKGRVDAASARAQDEDHVPIRFARESVRRAKVILDAGGSAW